MRTYISLIVLFTCLLPQTVLSQSVHPDPVYDIETVVKSIADNIMDNTTYKIINKETKETFNSSKGLPLEAKYRVESPYNGWKYWNGLLNLAFYKMGDTFDDAKYVDYANRNVSFGFDHDDYFQKQYDAGECRDDMYQKYRMKMLDDCGAWGASVIDSYKLNPQKRYRKYIDKVADYMMNGQLRLESGIYCRVFPEKWRVMSDDVYMSVPFLCRMAEISKDEKYLDEAINQIFLFHEQLWDETTQLYYHVWYGDEKVHGVARWGRGYAWTFIGLVELLDHMPEDHPKRDSLIGVLKKQIVGVSRYQDASGLWHQLLDQENTYLETSCSAMFTYAIAKAVNEGWIHIRYANVAAQGWRGVETKITADGQVMDICQGTGVTTANYYYANRKRPLNDIHALGMVLMAGCEVKKLHEKGFRYQW